MRILITCPPMLRAIDRFRPAFAALGHEIHTPEVVQILSEDELVSLVPGFEGWILRIIGSTGFFGMTRIGRFLMLKDRSAFKAWLLSLAEKKPHAILVAHGNPVLENTSQALRASAARL